MKSILFTSALIALAPIASAATIFSSLPHDSNPTLGVNETNTVGVSFVPTSTDFVLTGLTAPLTFLNSTPSQPVIFELWSSHVINIGSGIFRQRPDSLLGSWTTAPVPASGPLTFSDVQVSIAEGPTLAHDSTYWFLVRAGWSGLDPNTHVRWAGSVPFSGFGYGERMLALYSGSISPSGDNQDPGKLLAFEVSGSVVPEPSTVLFLVFSTALVALKRQRPNPKDRFGR